jgi:hypothetical protein
LYTERLQEMDMAPTVAERHAVGEGGGVFCMQVVTVDQWIHRTPPIVDDGRS